LPETPAPMGWMISYVPSLVLATQASSEAAQYRTPYFCDEKQLAIRREWNIFSQVENGMT